MRLLATLVAVLSCSTALAQEPAPAETAPTSAPATTTEPASAAPAAPQKPLMLAQATESAAPNAPGALPQAELLPPEHQPLAGYANGSFFLRDPHDWFVLFPKGRLQFDGYSFLNRGDTPNTTVSNSSSDPRPKNTFFVRRARVELQGTFMGHWDYHIAGEYASTPSTGQTGIVADAYVICDYLTWLKIQGGQYDIPFTLENRTSDKYFDFMERSIPVRAFAVPGNKDQGVMAWGWLPKEVAYYSIGIFNGDGQNFKNQDNWPAIIGRGFVAPLAWMPIAQKQYPWLKQIWVGASFWWQEASNLGGASAPSTGAAQNDVTSMTTQGGFTFFNASYANGTNADGPVRSHLTLNGDVVKWALEGNFPIWKLGLRFELIHVNQGLIQYNDVVALSPAAVPGLKRTGGTFTGGFQNAWMDGYGWYIEAWGWILGDNSFLEIPGVEPMPHIRRFKNAKEPRWGLAVYLKYENTSFTVHGLPGTPQMGGATVADPQSGETEIRTFELGVNGWATKHVRLTVNYIMNYITGDSAIIKKNFFYNRAEHELLARVGINL
jgi:phosphate-selective porin